MTPLATSAAVNVDAAAKSTRPAAPAAPAAGRAESGFSRASDTKATAATFRSLVDGSNGGDLRHAMRDEGYFSSRGK
jgi:hypothetical protein